MRRFNGIATNCNNCNKLKRSPRERACGIHKFSIFSFLIDIFCKARVNVYLDVYEEEDQPQGQDGQGMDPATSPLRRRGEVSHGGEAS